MRGLSKAVTAASPVRYEAPPPPGRLRLSDRSWPALKLPPAPVRTTTLTSSLLLAASRASARACHCSALKAFFFFGRFKVSTRMPSCSSCKTVSLMFGSPLAKTGCPRRMCGRGRPARPPKSKIPSSAGKCQFMFVRLVGWKTAGGGIPVPVYPFFCLDAGSR